MFSYGNGQDSGGSISTSNDNDKLHMTGNAWKAFKLASPLEITEDIVLSVTVEMIKEAEFHSICLDSTSDGDGLHLYPHCFQLGGTQEMLGMLQLEEEETYLKEGDTITYVLPFGKYLYGTTANFLGFIQDNDQDTTVGETTFSNVGIWSE
eukprot:14834895-Ditylum_brightwellii.AAC.1